MCSLLNEALLFHSYVSGRVIRWQNTQANTWSYGKFSTSLIISYPIQKVKYWSWRYSKIIHSPKAFQWIQSPPIIFDIGVTEIFIKPVIILTCTLMNLFCCIKNILLLVSLKWYKWYKGIGKVLKDIEYRCCAKG